MNRENLDRECPIPDFEEFFGRHEEQLFLGRIDQVESGLDPLFHDFQDVQFEAIQEQAKHYHPVLGKNQEIKGVVFISLQIRQLDNFEVLRGIIRQVLLDLDLDLGQPRVPLGHDVQILRQLRVLQLFAETQDPRARQTLALRKALGVVVQTEKFRESPVFVSQIGVFGEGFAGRVVFLEIRTRSRVRSTF